ncbi:unnamed protein product, partial [Chrysoparadoxa australica]
MLPNTPGAKRKKMGRITVYLVSVITLLCVIYSFAVAKYFYSSGTIPLTDPPSNADATNALLQQQEVRMKKEALSKEKQVLLENRARLAVEMDRDMVAEKMLNKEKAINEDLERKLLAQLGRSAHSPKEKSGEVPVQCSPKEDFIVK